MLVMILEKHTTLSFCICQILNVSTRNEIPVRKVHKNGYMCSANYEGRIHVLNSRTLTFAE